VPQKSFKSIARAVNPLLSIYSNLTKTENYKNTMLINLYSDLGDRYHQYSTWV